MRISLRDDGCGLNAEPGQPGTDGLNNMRQRLQEMGVLRNCQRTRDRHKGYVCSAFGVVIVIVRDMFFVKGMNDRFMAGKNSDCIIVCESLIHQMP